MNELVGEFVRGETIELFFRETTTSEADGVDLSGATVVAGYRRRGTSGTLGYFDCTLLDQVSLETRGAFLLSLPAAAADALEGEYELNVRITLPSGRVIKTPIVLLRVDRTVV
jgi:hypothetical protein